MTDKKEKPELVTTPEYQWDNEHASCSNPYIWDIVKDLLPSERSTVLDVGCGNGFLTAKITALGHDVQGLDSSTSGIDVASRSFPGARFHCASAYDDLKAFGPVDCVVTSEVIEHLDKPKLFLRNIRDVLKPGGKLIITTPYHGYLKNLALSLVDGWDRHFSVDWDGGHVKFFSKKTLAKMLGDTGFGDLSFHPAGRIYLLWKSIVFCARKMPF